MTRRVEGLLLAALLVLQARLFYEGRGAPTNYDEGVYLASLDALLHGAGIGEIFTSQPPGFYVLLRAAGLVDGASVVDVRVAFIALALTGAIAAYFLGRALGGPAVGLATAGLLGVAAPYATEATKVQADLPSVALALAALAFAAHGFRAHASLVWSILAGVALVLALSVKLLAAPVVVPLLALALVWRPGRRPLLAFVAGAAGALTVLAVVFAGSLGEIWADAIDFQRSAREAEPADIDGNVDRIVGFLDFRTPAGWIVPLGAAAAVVAPLLRRGISAGWLWTWALAAAVFLAVRGSLNDHHLILLGASLAVPAGIALGGLLVRLSPPARAIAAAGAVLVLSGAYVQEWRRLDTNNGPEPVWIRQAAATLAARTRGDELVVTDLPITAVLASRRLPPDLVDTSFARFNSRSLTERDVIAAIDAHRVRVVVAARAFTTDRGLLEALGGRFRVRRDRLNHIVFAEPRGG
jgi:hypothetical protein